MSVVPKGLAYLLTGTTSYQSLNRSTGWSLRGKVTDVRGSLNVRLWVALDTYRNEGYYYGKSKRGFIKACKKRGLVPPTRRELKFILKQV